MMLMSGRPSPGSCVDVDDAAAVTASETTCRMAVSSSTSSPHTMVVFCSRPPQLDCDRLEEGEVVPDTAALPGDDTTRVKALRWPRRTW